MPVRGGYRRHGLNDRIVRFDDRVQKVVAAWQFILMIYDCMRDPNCLPQRTFMSISGHNIQSTAPFIIKCPDGRLNREPILLQQSEETLRSIEFVN
jgi:hypothetical protein